MHKESRENLVKRDRKVFLVQEVWLVKGAALEILEQQVLKVARVQPATPVQLDHLALVESRDLKETK